MAESALKDRPAAPAPPVTGQCPNCGAGIVDGQIACLDCAAPLAVAGRSSGRRRRIQIGGAIVLLLLAGLGAGYAVSRVADDDEVTVAEAQAGQPAPNAPAPPAPAPDSQVAPAQPPPSPTGPTPPDAPDPAGAEDSSPQDAPGAVTPGGDSGSKTPENWPAGRSAYTVILLSSPDRAGAQARAREAIRAGIDAGVLKSDDYRSLNPGYFVAFAGQYESKAEATRQAARLAEQGFDGGYARFVKSS